jgi:signal transduction histidine kinase
VPVAAGAPIVPDSGDIDDTDQIDHIARSGDPPDESPEVYTLANLTEQPAAPAAASSALHLDLVDLSELADRVLDKARATGERDWVLEETSPPEQLFVLADAESLSDAMQTIASDAASHTAPGDRITLGVVLRENELRLWMHDDGTGNSSSWQRLYTRFGGDNMFAAVTPIARAHGGRVDVVGAPGRGATFTIVIPTEPVPT